MDYKKIDTISALLNRGDGIVVESGMTVVSSEMPETKMFLVGYIGYYEDFDLECSVYMPDLNAPIKVTHSKVKAGEKTYTIMKTVSMAGEDNRVEIDHTHKIGILESVPQCVDIMQRIETGSVTRDYLCHKIKLVKGDVHADRFVCENNALYYNTMPDDVLLELGDRQLIANKFFCLCRYTNPITGLMSHNLFNPDNIIILSEKQIES